METFISQDFLQLLQDTILWNKVIISTGARYEAQKLETPVLFQTSPHNLHSWPNRFAKFFKAELSFRNLLHPVANRVVFVIQVKRNGETFVFIILPSITRKLDAEDHRWLFRENSRKY